MLETLKKLLVEELQIDPATVTPEAELSADLGINSIELANLIMLCEEKFDVTIDDDDIHKLVTVGDVASYLESLKSAQTRKNISEGISGRSRANGRRLSGCLKKTARFPPSGRRAVLSFYRSASLYNTESLWTSHPLRERLEMPPPLGEVGLLTNPPNQK